MSANGVGFPSPIVHAPTGKSYLYRQGLGMVESAEYAVFFDDFQQDITTNVPTGWDAAVIDTGATVIQRATLDASAQGMISIVSTTASEGAAIYLPKSVHLETGKKFFMEVRVKLDDVTDNTFQFGLSDLTATTNPEDLWTTTAANVIAMGILDGSATIKYLTDAANAGTAVASTTGTLVTSTWTNLGFAFDGASTITFYKDGKSIGSTTTTVPTATLLAPFVGALNGNGAGSNVQLVDFVRYAVER
jgi:hypothetical protein